MGALVAVVLLATIAVVAVRLGRRSLKMRNRPGRGRKDPPRRPPSPLMQDRVTAAHEAGHATVAWFSSFVTRIEYADIDEGRVRFISKGLESTRCRWDVIRVALAGLAGESASIGRILSSAGAATDLREALRIARDLEARSRPETLASLLARHDGVRHRLDISRMYVEPPSESVTRILNCCYHEARETLDAREWAFRAIEKELLARRRLETKGLKRLLGQRPWA